MEIATAWCLSCSKQDLPPLPAHLPARTATSVARCSANMAGTRRLIFYLRLAHTHRAALHPPTPRTLTHRRPPGAVTCELPCLPVCSERDDVLRGLLFKLSVFFFFPPPPLHSHVLFKWRKEGYAIYAYDKGRLCFENAARRLRLHLAAAAVQSVFSRKAQNINLKAGDC